MSTEPRRGRPPGRPPKPGIETAPLEEREAHVGLLPPGDRADTADLPIDSLKDKFPDAKYVTVQRVNGVTRRIESLGQVPLDILDDEFMYQEFGAGIYQLHLRTAEGRVNGSKTTYVIGERARKRETSPAPAPAPAPAPIIETGNSAVEMLRQELAEQRQVMLRMVDAIATRSTQQPTTSILDLVTALSSLKKLEPPPAQSFPEKLMERAFSMATRSTPAAGGEGGEGESWFSLLWDVWTAMKPQLAKTNGNGNGTETAAAPAAGAIAAAVPDETEVVEVDLTPAIEQLKDHCRKGRPAELISEMIGEQAANDENFRAVVLELIGRPLDEILAMDPELQMPGYKKFFSEIYERLHVRIVGSAGNGSGASRNGTDA